MSYITTDVKGPSGTSRGASKNVSPQVLEQGGKVLRRLLGMLELQVPPLTRKPYKNLPTWLRLIDVRLQCVSSVYETGIL